MPIFSEPPRPFGPDRHKKTRPVGTLMASAPGRPLRRKTQERQERGRGQAGAAGALPRTPPGEMISPGPPHSFQLVDSALGNADDIRSPRRRPQAGGIHSRRQARRASCKPRSPYSVSGADGRWRHSGEGKCHDFPRAPSFLSAFCRSFWGTQKSGSEQAGQGSVAKAGRLGRRVSAAKSVQACALHPPAVADRCSRAAATSVRWEGISRWLGWGVCPKLGGAFVCREQTPFNALGPPGAFERPGRHPPVAGIHSRR